MSMYFVLPLGKLWLTLWMETSEVQVDALSAVIGRSGGFSTGHVFAN